jgi:integrase/recombinase XerC
MPAPESRRAPANKGKRYPARAMPAAQVGALIAAIQGDGSIALRNRALVATTYRAALRCAEALALHPCDVDLDSGVVTVERGKGDRSRTVAIGDEAVGLVRVWRERRRRLGLDDRGPLFSSLKGNRLDPSYLRRLLPRLAKQAGIEGRVHPHRLRHARATEMANAGVPVHVIRDALGHEWLSTTDVYLRHVAPQQVIEAMRDDWRLTP